MGRDGRWEPSRRKTRECRKSETVVCVQGSEWATGVGVNLARAALALTGQEAWGKGVLSF